MPVTLAQASLNAATDLDRQVIDEFRKSSFLLDAMPFHDAVNPGGAGATLTYGYTRLTSQPTASFRAINAEYTPSEVTKAQYTTTLKPLGGSFQIDRVLDAIAASAETALQMQQKIKAARSLFHKAAILGDSSADANSFDGLSKALTGTATELTAPAAGSTSAGDYTTVTDAAGALKRVALLRKLLALLDGPADALLVNGDGEAALQTLGDFTNLGGARDLFQGSVSTVLGVPIVNLGEQPGSSSPIIPTTSGLSDIYAVRLNLMGFHGVSLAGRPLVQTWLPDFTTPGAVKTGEVEMVASVALKATKSAAVLRGVKVA